jgi:hypothetical protein
MRVKTSFGTVQRSCASHVQADKQTQRNADQGYFPTFSKKVYRCHAGESLEKGGSI